MNSSSSDSSFELLSSFFDMAESPEDIDHSITVHVIGRPLTPRIKSPSGPPKKTYHTEQWTLGTDVSRQDAETAKDQDTGCLYAWYRLIGGRWTWKLVTRDMFAKLKAVEDGRII